MNTTRSQRTRRIALGAAIVLAVAACDSDGENGGETTQPVATQAPVTTDPPVTEPPDGFDPCDPVGQLQERDLNDRCVDFEGGEIMWEEDDFTELGIWTLSDPTCGPDALITAAPDRVLVTSEGPDELSDAVAEVVARLSDSFTAEAMGSEVPTAKLIKIEGAKIEEIVALLPTLQGVGWSADLNYLEPLQPNNGFRPDDDPLKSDPAGANLPSPPLENPDTAQVLVLDSTGDAATFDIDGNGHWDEDHGHGRFVQSIIDRLAPDAGVRLAPVTLTASDQLLKSGRWAPMMFSDMDILTAMHAASPNGEVYEFVNMSLGGPGCTTSGFEFENDTSDVVGIGIGERVALARGMRSMSSDSTMFIAAAGNHGGDVKHFPAAWRDADATTKLAAAVAGLPDTHVDINGAPVPVGDVAVEIDDLHAYFVDRMYAVGSVESDGSTSTFSNCGDWVNATAHGSNQIGYYPHPDNESKFATWSGTSFATANVTAQLAGGVTSGVTLDVGGLECPEKPASDTTGSEAGTTVAEANPSDDPDE